MLTVELKINDPGMAYLVQQLADAQYQADTFKQAMMKAQSQSDVMRRFIEDQEYQEQFAGFVLIARKHARRADVFTEFGFNDHEGRTKP